MTTLTMNDGVQKTIATPSLESIQSLYEQGLYLDAFERSRPLGPLPTWRGSNERILAGRLSACLGAPRVGQTLLRLAFREHGDDPRAIYFNAMMMLSRLGPLKTLEFVKSVSIERADVKTQSDWELLQARILNAFRDFQRADEHLAVAEQLTPARPWVHVEKAGLLFSQDQHDAALDSAKQALELNSSYRPGIQMAAYLLVQSNRDDEALDLLQRSVLRLQSGDLVAQLAALETELELYDEAFEHYQQAERLFPLMSLDKGETRWLAGRQSDAAYHMAKYDLAAEKADVAEGEFFKAVAERLRSDKVNAERVVLPVGFVRQHYDTCAPATLAAITKHWSMPVDHLDVVENICYDGTPAHSERKWANEHGFVTREFRVTLETTKALIDRGIPFTLTTVGPQIGHLQAVIGYDERRGTILIRDPSERHMSECLAAEMIEHFASTGPRGMALVPREKAELLDGIELPESDLYDLYFELELALQDHRRDEAGKALQQMERLEAEHRLTINGKASLARYDADDIESLNCLNRLLAKYPEDVNLRLAKLAYLAQLGRSQERRKLLEEISAEENCDPLFWLQLCQDLSEDARQEGRIEELLQRALRYRPTDAAALGELADLRWRQQRRHEAFELYRLAACSSDKSEGRSSMFFGASRYLHRTDEALQFLQDRQKRFGSQSTWPARTLGVAYEQSGKVAEALLILDSAMEQHPDDGDFMLVVADTYARYGKYQRSQQILSAAEKKCHRTSWLRANGYLAMYVARQDVALMLWQQVLQAEPLARDAHEQVAGLLAELHGNEVAVEHLRKTVEKFPANYALSVLQIEWLRETPESCEQAVRVLLQAHPTDAWAFRELAISLTAQRRWDDACQAVSEAEKLEPTSPVAHLLRAEVDEARGRIDEAKESCRNALRQAIDYEPAIHSLMSLCDSKSDRIEALQFIRDELTQQVIHGETLFAFCQHASGTLEDTELLGVLQQILGNRSDLWQIWAVVTLHLIQMDRLDEADIVAREMVERFPLMPSCWLYLSQVQAARKNAQQQIQALEQALEINPTWTMAARQLAEVFAEQDQKEKAEKILRRALSQSPREAETLGCLAELLWSVDRRDEAIDAVRRAVDIEPGYQWCWDAMRCWGPIVDQPNLAIDAAKELAQRRPTEPRSWLILAEAFQAPQHRNECLQALDKALELSPRNLDAYSMKAWALAAAHRFDEAIEVCRPAVFGDDTPLQLRGREAEIIYQSGNEEGAIASMRQVLEADPDYVWAWNCLYNWYEELERFEGCKEAAEQFVRIAPRNEEAWAYLGDAERKLGNLPTAAQHFARAMELNPNYAEALGALLHATLELKDAPAARQALDEYPNALNELGRMIWEVEIATAQQDQDQALEVLANICQHEEVEYGHVHHAVTPMMNAEWGGAVRHSLVSLLQQPETSVSVAAILADVCLYLEDTRTIDEQLSQLDPQQEAWAALAEQALTQAASQQELVAWGESLMKKYLVEIRGSSRCWAAAALVYEAQGRANELIRWMDDWRSRDDLKPYMLLTLIEHLWRKKDRQTGNAIAREASEMPEAPDELQLWMALYESEEERWEAVDRCLKCVNTCNLHPFYQLLYQLLTTVAVSALARDGGYADSRKSLAELGKIIGSNDKFLKKVYTDCQRRLARANRKPMWGAVYAILGGLT